MTAFLPEWIKKYTKNDSTVRSWYACGLDQVATHAATRHDAGDWKLGTDEFAEWEAFLAPFNPPAALRENLQKLARGNVRVVVTGQQAGLLGGPLFTLYKAIGAGHWARKIARETGTEVVPVFWVASDDHDFAEVAEHRWLNASGTPQTWKVAEQPSDAGRPVYARRLSREELGAMLEAFENSVPPSEFRDEISAFMRELMQHESVDWEAQFLQCIVRWLGPLGIVPVAPRLSWLRRRAVPVMRREIERQGASAQMLKEAGEELAALGAKGLTIHRAGTEANFFLELDGVRAKVQWENGVARCLNPKTGELIAELESEELLRRLEEKPEAFSPNAALRPLVQDAALPSVAYIGGPSEVLYHAQIGRLYADFNVFRPAVIPRPSVVLVEPRIERLLGKLGLSAEESLALGPDGVREKAAHGADQSGLAEKTKAEIAAANDAMERLLSLLQDETADTGLIKAVEKMQHGLVGGAGKLQERVTQYLARKNDDATRQAERVVDAFWPGGAPQERALGALSPLLRTAGMDAPVRIAEAIEGTEFGRQVIRLG